MIIFVNRFFYPDHSATSQMLTDLAVGLAADGHDVRVITSRLIYDDSARHLPATETHDGVKILRVWSTRFGRAGVVGRAVDYATFLLATFAAVAWHARRGTIVVAKTDPPLLSSVLAPAVAIRRARLVNWMQDVFPEVAEVIWPSTSRLSRLLYGALRWWRNRTVKHAAATVAIGERMAERFVALGAARARVHVIPNWANEHVIHPVAREANRLRKDWGLQDAFVVGYSGNLGRAHDFMPFVDAIERVATAAPDLGIVWLFIGGGAGHDAFKAELAARKITAVVFKPYQPRDILSESLGVADVHLVTLKPALEGLIVPSKYYGNAAAGRAQIFIGAGDGEVARELARTGGGRVVADADAAALAATVMDLARHPAKCAEMGQKAAAAHQSRYTRRAAVDAWNRLLASL